MTIQKMRQKPLAAALMIGLVTFGCGDVSSNETDHTASDAADKSSEFPNRERNIQFSKPNDPPSPYANKDDGTQQLVAVVAQKPLEVRIAALVRLGAEYDTDSDGNVIEINFRKKKLTPAAWSAFKAFPNLEILDLDNTKLVDDDLKHVQGFKKLRILSLQENPITDAGLKHIKGLTTLENLALTKTKVTGKGLDSIAGMTKLQTLNLSHCNIGDEGLKNLVKMSDLETLALQNASVKGPGLEHVGKLKNMITLTLSNSQLKGDSLLHLKNLSKLRIINLYDCKVSTTSVEKLEKEISSLAIFR